MTAFENAIRAALAEGWRVDFLSGNGFRVYVEALESDQLKSGSCVSDSLEESLALALEQLSRHFDVFSRFELHIEALRRWGSGPITPKWLLSLGAELRRGHRDVYVIGGLTLYSLNDGWRCGLDVPRSSIEDMLVTVTRRSQVRDLISAFSEPAAAPEKFIDRSDSGS